MTVVVCSRMKDDVCAGVESFAEYEYESVVGGRRLGVAGFVGGGIFQPMRRVPSVYWETRERMSQTGYERRKRIKEKNNGDQPRLETSHKRKTKRREKEASQAGAKVPDDWPGTRAWCMCRRRLYLLQVRVCTRTRTLLGAGQASPVSPSR
jgi:hypothetical protein